MIGTRWDTTPILIVSQFTAQFEKYYLVTILRSYLVLLVLARRLCVFMVGEAGDGTGSVDCLGGGTQLSQ